MTGQAILSVERIGKAFGGLRVLTDVSFQVHEGETVGLIGPNGAGKTTLFNIVTGFLAPDRGTVGFAGIDIRRQKPNQRARDGLVRTFQKSLVFPELSVRENIALAARARAGTGYCWRSATQAIGDANDRADALLFRAQLSGRGNDKVSRLSYGDQRIVDILIAMAMAPKLLLLDEPTAGLAKAEGEHLIELVRGHDHRTALLLIAHDLDLVFSACDRVGVLDLGRLVALDAPAAIRANPEARAAYLGALAEAS
ncbi:MAG: ABC transporter ATP-binding protein [Acetobacteraceae bacterium]